MQGEMTRSQKHNYGKTNPTLLAIGVAFPPALLSAAAGVVMSPLLGVIHRVID